MTTMNRTMKYRELTLDVRWLYDTYNEALDDGEINQWADFFVEDSHYRITSKSNLDQNMPLSFVLCDGLGMIRDRAAALEQTVFFRKRCQRRIVSGVRVMSMGEHEDIVTCSSFSIYESLHGESSKLLVCGKSNDVVVEENGILKFKKRVCILDTNVVPGSIVYPI